MTKEKFECMGCGKWSAKNKDRDYCSKACKRRTLQQYGLDEENKTK